MAIGFGGLENPATARFFSGVLTLRFSRQSANSYDQETPRQLQQALLQSLVFETRHAKSSSKNCHETPPRGLAVPGRRTGVNRL